MKQIYDTFEKAIWSLDRLIAKDPAVDKIARVKEREVRVLDRIAVSRQRMEYLKTETCPNWFSRSVVRELQEKNHRNRVIRSAMHTLLVNELARLGREGVSGEDMNNLMICK